MSSILKEGKNCWKIGEVDASGLLIDARDYYKAIYDAAAQAKNFILMSGWEFNSDVRLLRGKDAENCATEVTLLPYLNELCKKNPDLHIYILAWDFMELFSFQREWQQSRLFNQSESGRIKFKFDSRHAIGASHHQKMVVVDGQLAFVGGLDLCCDRWDDRKHKLHHHERKEPDPATQTPFHDIQSFHTGPVV